jgi:peptide/nickel transport system ATP-binding protein
LKIEKLCVEYQQKVLVDITLNIKNSLALVGQSGSGKSLTLKALLGMLPKDMQLDLKYEADFDLNDKNNIAFVPQNPFTALSPLTKIKKQFLVSKDEQLKLLQDVGLDNSLLERFPPELSGGQLQRIVLAMALERKPKLLMLDEPTTALDEDTKNMVIQLLKKLQLEFGFKILFVTHDILSVKELCEDITVIKDARVVENGKMSELLQNPQIEYTKILIESNFANRKFRE